MIVHQFLETRHWYCLTNFVESIRIPDLTKEVLKIVEEHGYQDWQMIEPVDGFHPTVHSR